MSLPEPNDDFMEGLYQQMKSRAELMAPQLAPDTDAKKLTPVDVDMLWDRRHMSLEEEWRLWRQTNADGSPMFTREQIGLMVFRDREGLSKRGGRIEPKDQIPWTNQQAKRAEARRAAMMPTDMVEEGV